jgi:GNAT superfamily N-acetyltransferase
MRAAPKTYYSLVIVNKASDRIVGAGALFVERKFLRGLGSVGHIEDIAVDKQQQGKKLGLRIIQALTHISESSGAYKTILNCSDDNIRELYLAPGAFLVAYVPFLQHSTKSAVLRGRRTRWWVFSLSFCSASHSTRQAKYAPVKAQTPRL